MPKKLRNKPSVTFLPFATYIATIRNSVGSTMFRTVFARVNGKTKDITRNGELSCACFVSSILFLLKTTSDVHTTVDGLVRDVRNSGWKKIRTPRLGAVLVWSRLLYPDGEEHRHVGFSIGNGKAISNSAAKGTPVIHHWTYGKRGSKNYRPMQAIYWHPSFAKETKKK